MSDVKFKHIKLDRLVNSPNQRIFKTTIHDYSDRELDIDNLHSNLSTTVDNIKYNEMNTIMYSNYMPEDTSNKNNEYELINFTDIDFLYNHFQTKDYTAIKKYIGGINNYFAEQFKNNISTKTNKQNILYFNFDNTPIDVINISNMAYFLSPFQTIKNVEIQNQEQLLKNTKASFKTPYKNHYEQMWNYMTSRTVYYPEQNNIPIYDLKYNFLDTVNLESYDEMVDWLDTYDFLSTYCTINDEIVNISSYVTYIKDDYYSIKLKNVLDVIQSPEYVFKYSTDDIKNLIIDLLSYINRKTSIANYIDKYGTIANLHSSVIQTIEENPILSSIFNLSLDEFKNNINNKFRDSYTAREIPQNTIYISNMNKNIKFTDKQYTMPSVYMDFFNLKNTQNPNYNYDVTLASVIFNADDITEATDGEYILSLYADTNAEMLNTRFNPQGDHDLVKLHIDLPSGIYQFSYQNGYLYTDLPKDISKNVFDYKFSQVTDSEIKYPNNERDLGVNWNLPPEYLEIRKDYVIDANNPPDISLLHNRLYNPYNIIYYRTSSTNGYQHLPSDVFESYDLTESIQRTEENINFEITIEDNSGIDFIISLNNDNKIRKDDENFYTWDNIGGNISFKMKNKAEEFQIDKFIYNYNQILLFDNDQTKSLKFNSSDDYDYYKISNYTVAIPTKNIVSSIVKYASEKDRRLSDVNSAYTSIYTERMQDKEQAYLDIFNEHHVENNKLVETGDLNGIRIYQKLGENNNFPWMTYKYISNRRNDIVDAFNITKNSEFKSYNINRLSKHMEYDSLNNVKFRGIDDVKEMNTKDDTSKPYVFFVNEDDYICSSCFHCKLRKNSDDKTTICNLGYCTLPYDNDRHVINASAIVPTGVFWSRNNYETYKNISIRTSTTVDNAIIFNNNNHYDQKIYTKTPVEINDDLEIFFIPSGREEDVLNYLTSCYNEDKKEEYYAIFQGFGGTNVSGNTNNEILYDNYLFRNNNELYTEKKFKEMLVSDYCKPVKEYIKMAATNPNSADKNICEFFNMRLITILNNYVVLDKEKDEEYINSPSADFLTWIENININNLLSGSPYISGLYEHNIPSASQFSVRLVYNSDKNTKVPGTELSYYDLANTNLYDLMKNVPFTTKDITFSLDQCPNKKTVSDKYLMYKGFVINPNTPFNGPHTIKENTEITATQVDINEQGIFTFTRNQNVLLPGYNLVMRTVNWWGDTPKCVGTFLIKPIDSFIENSIEIKFINKYLNNYDLLETIDNNFRYNQGEYTKSNIYSLRIKNSGLNPANTIIPNNLSQSIALKDYVLTDNKYKNLYKQITYNEMVKNFDELCEPTGDLYYIYKHSSVSYIRGLDPSKEENREALQKYYQQNNGYYKLDYDKINVIENTKKEIRDVFENAIKNSISRYMPIDTKLWKIIYEGK